MTPFLLRLISEATREVMRRPCGWLVYIQAEQATTGLLRAADETEGHR